MNTIISKDQGGVPPAGNTNQVLKKNSNTDYDYDWGSASGGSGLYTVNADETETTSFTDIIGRMQNGSGGWVIGAFAGIATFTVDSTTMDMVNHGGQLDGSITCVFTYTAGKELRLKFRAKAGVAGNANNRYQLVFGNMTLLWDGWSGGPNTWTFGGVDITATLGPIVTNMNLYEIVWDTTNVTLWVNGVSLASVAPVFPSTDPSITITCAANPGGGGGTCNWRMTEIIKSQEL